MNKRKKQAAFIAGLCGAVISYAIVILLKGSIETHLGRIIIVAGAGAAQGFCVCFVMTVWALRIFEKKDWKLAFALGPIFGFFAGAVNGAVATVLIAPQYFTASVIMGGIIGALIGVVSGFIIGPPLAWMFTRPAEDGSTKERR